ncbi:unnamed protein product [Paramecium sonneborni]|uniref:Transmembrane protein n=1 Tax=Paramecium sonneborni TaxID=65129 RepID=A0A8S1RHS5_9CILI|nr:unnamed protein product [Paramecium sonneborni]
MIIFEQKLKCIMAQQFLYYQVVFNIYILMQWLMYKIEYKYIREKVFEMRFKKSIL